MNLQNLHTHTAFCDGADMPEEIIKTALEKGFDSIGFSEHSYMWASDFSVKIGDHTKEYKEEINRLKEKYEGIIDIFLGLEFEMYSKVDTTGFDYLIGSAHYFKIGDKYVGFDRSQQEVENVINTYFNGNGMAYAKYYYKTLAQLPEYGDFDIIGHFDLIMKHSDNITFFDASSKEYINAAIEAMEALKGKIPVFEVNTGAMARGYKDAPYPAKWILEELKKHNSRVIITSDFHRNNTLDYAFSETAKVLSDMGFKDFFNIDFIQK